MLNATWIFKGNTNGSFSPAFPRGELAAIFSTYVFALIGSPTVTITVQHKASDATSWSSAGVFDDFTTIGNFEKYLSGLNEMIRFKYSFGAGDAEGDGFLASMGAPSWQPL